MKNKEAVLIVDDQPNWLEMLVNLLEDEYEVTSARSYEEAHRAILERKHPFALAIIDLRLEETDAYDVGGLGLLVWLKGFSEHTSTIVVTGYPTVETARRAFRDFHVADYISKSDFNVHNFREAVHEAILAFRQR